jgi:hypothetical protein
VHEKKRAWGCGIAFCSLAKTHFARRGFSKYGACW